MAKIHRISAPENDSETQAIKALAEVLPPGYMIDLLMGELSTPGSEDFMKSPEDAAAVIRRMVADLGFGVEIIAAPIVREADGLALSSRNVHLGPQARRQALALVRCLDSAEVAVANGERDREALLEGVRAEIGRAPQAKLDYAELRDPGSLETSPGRLAGPALLALAVHFDADPDGQGAPVRLIDNRVLLPEPRSA